MGLRNALLGAAAAIGVAGCEVPQENKPVPAPTTEAAPAAPEVGQTADETAKKAAEAAKVPGDAPAAPEAAPFDPETIKYLGKKLYVTSQATGEGLKLRSAPDGTKEDNVLLRMPVGSEMMVLGPSQGDYQWVLYTGPDGTPKSGWAAMRNAGATYLSETKEAPKPEAPKAPEVKEFAPVTQYVISSATEFGGLALRETGEKTGKEVKRLPAGTEVVQTGPVNADGFVKVTAGGVEGFVGAVYLSTTKPAPEAPKAPEVKEFAPVTQYVMPSVTQFGGLVLRATGEKTGTEMKRLPAGTEVVQTGPVNAAGYVEVTVGGVKGYVGGIYLSTTKPVEPAAPAPEAKK